MYKKEESEIKTIEKNGNLGRKCLVTIGYALRKLKFSCVELMGLESELETFIDLSQMLVKIIKHIVYLMIYFLVMITLILRNN